MTQASQAIYYIQANDIEANNIDKNGDNPLKTIPSQAVVISLNQNLNKQTLLSALAKACQFPEYFTPNWDSAFDCLTDSDVDYLSLDLTNIHHIDTKDLNTFTQLIEDAYADFGKPQLWVVVK